jgi:hypothetical protein
MDERREAAREAFRRRHGQDYDTTVRHATPRSRARAARRSGQTTARQQRKARQKLRNLSRKPPARATAPGHTAELGARPHAQELSTPLTETNITEPA